MIDTSQLPVVDVHCHPFLNRGNMHAEQFTTTVSFGGVSVEYMAAGGVTVDDDLIDELQRFKRDTLYFRYMQRQLAGFFKIEPAPPASNFRILSFSDTYDRSRLFIPALASVSCPRILETWDPYSSGSCSEKFSRSAWIKLNSFRRRRRSFCERLRSRRVFVLQDRTSRKEASPAASSSRKSRRIITT